MISVLLEIDSNCVCLCACMCVCVLASVCVCMSCQVYAIDVIIMYLDHFQFVMGRKCWQGQVLCSKEEKGQSLK